MWQGFVATRSDLEPGLRAIEAEIPLKYVADGWHGNPSPEIFHSALDIPRLGEMVEFDYSKGSLSIRPAMRDHPQRFLVVPAHADFVIREIQLTQGGIRYEMDMSTNPHALVFAPGGFDAEGVLTWGTLSCEDDSAETVAFFEQFRNALCVGFVRALDGDDFRTFWWLGPEALKMLQRGEKVVTGRESPIYPCEHLLAEKVRIEAERESSFVKRRRNRAESWDYLWEETAMMDASLPRTPPKRVGPAGYNRKGSGINFYKCGEFRDESSNLIWRLENLTIPSIFICRCGVSEVSFRNTSLVGSSFCWNDFDEVDFRDANLSGCDLRCSVFRKVTFAGAALRRADMRMSSFEDCDFSGADLTGAKLTLDQANELPLSEEQKRLIDWQDSEGPVPLGG